MMRFVDNDHVEEVVGKLRQPLVDVGRELMHIGDHNLRLIRNRDGLPLSSVQANGPTNIWLELKTPAFRQKHFWRFVMSIASNKPSLIVRSGAITITLPMTAMPTGSSAASPVFPQPTGICKNRLIFSRQRKILGLEGSPHAAGPEADGFDPRFRNRDWRNRHLTVAWLGASRREALS